LAAQPDQFDALIRQHARVIGGAIRRACGSAYRRLVPDVEQDVYLAMWRVLESGKKISHPASYLYKVALRAALSAIRKHASETPTEDTEIQAVAERGHQTPPEADSLLAAERAQWLVQALEALPPDHARAVRAYLGGFNHSEVAALYGWTEAVARHRIYRGIQSLKEKMSEKTS
jgi:RNA polymerase sigma factor (sigma-70 family)